MNELYWIIFFVLFIVALVSFIVNRSKSEGGWD